MDIVYGFKRSNDPVNGDNTLWLYNEDDGTVTFTIKREPVGEALDPYQITWFDLEWHHWNGLSSSDYTVLTKPQEDTLVDGYYYFSRGQTEFDIKIRLKDDSIDESTVLEGLTVELTDIQEPSLYPHVIASPRHDTLSPTASIGIIDDDKEQIKLKVSNTSADEGASLNFTVRAEDPVPHDTQVYLQVQASTTADIVTDDWWVEGVIKAGNTSVKIPIRTLVDDELGDKRADVKLFNYDEDVVITDGDAVGTVSNITPTAELPKVYVDNAGTINEGEYANFTVRVEGNFTETIEVELYTWKTSEANQGGNGTDYDGFASKTITFQPNEPKSHTESIYIKPDSVQDDGETFELRIEKVSSNAEIGNYRGVATIKDVTPDPDLADTIPLPDMDTANSTPSTIGLDDISELFSEFGQIAFTHSLGTQIISTGFTALSATEREFFEGMVDIATSDSTGVFGGVTTAQEFAIDRYTSSAEFYEGFERIFTSVDKLAGPVTSGVEQYAIVTYDGVITDDEIFASANNLASVTMGTYLGVQTGVAVGAGVVLLGLTPAGWGVIIGGATGFVVSEVSTSVIEDTNAFGSFYRWVFDQLDKVGITALGAPYVYEYSGGTQDTADTTGQGGDFPIADPVWNGTAAAETNEYWQDKVSNANEFVNGGAGYDFILGSGGDDVINGEADSGQVNLFGPGAIRANFSVTTLGDGGYQVHSIDGSFGTDKYYNIDGAWFGGYGNIPGAWHNMADLVINTFNDGDGTLPSVTDPYDELFAGTSGDDFIIGGAGIDWFTATPGNDILYGGNGKDNDSSWNQVNFLNVPFSEIQWGYDIASDLLFSRHPDFGLDSYNRDITDFWAEDGGWHDRTELIGLADPEFVFV